MRLIPFNNKILQKMYSRHIKQFNYLYMAVWTRKKENQQLLMLIHCVPKNGIWNNITKNIL